MQIIDNSCNVSLSVLFTNLFQSQNLVTALQYMVEVNEKKQCTDNMSHLLYKFNV